VVPKGTIDYLVDIESSFFYPDKTSFLKEVREVLRDDGTFFYGVLVPSWRLFNLDLTLRKWFDVQSEEDVTCSVLRSLQLDSTTLSTFIDSHYPWCKRFDVMTCRSREVLPEAGMGH